MKAYNIDYSCGCKSEMMNNKGMHEPTGKKEQCIKHKQ